MSKQDSKIAKTPAPAHASPEPRGRTFWDLVAHVLGSPWLSLAMIVLVSAPFVLAALGVLDMKISLNGLSVSRPQKPTVAYSGPRVDGSWHGTVRDLDLGEFRSVFNNEIDLQLVRTGDTVAANGQIKTDSIIGGGYMGTAQIQARGLLSGGGEYLRLQYEVSNENTRGSGVMYLQIAATGLTADGYALFRRTNPANGRMGLGRVTISRPK